MISQNLKLSQKMFHPEKEKTVNHQKPSSKINQRSQSMRKTIRRQFPFTRDNQTKKLPLAMRIIRRIWAQKTWIKILTLMSKTYQLSKLITRKTSKPKLIPRKSINMLRTLFKKIITTKNKTNWRMVVKIQINWVKQAQKMSLLMIQIKKITLTKMNKIKRNRIIKQEFTVDSLKLSLSLRLFQTWWQRAFQ